MAACASQVITSLKRSPGNDFFWGRFFSAGTATFPTTSATATVTCGYLAPQSLVLVRNTAAGDVKLIEIAASRTNGPHGTITIGTVDGSSTSGTRTFHWCVLNP